MAAVVADTGPLVAAADRSEANHRLALSLVVALGRELLVPDPVVLEVDWLLRARLGDVPARAFLRALTSGSPRHLPLTAGTLERAVAIDERYADLGLGLVDATVMAVAEAERCPILTFDFSHFRAAPPLAGGAWNLFVEERHVSGLSG